VSVRRSTKLCGLTLVSLVSAALIGTGASQAALPMAALSAGRPLTAVLNGDNEVNASGVRGQGDLDGSGLGSVTVDTDANRVCWEITSAGIDLPAILAHIHRGVLDVNGPIVVTFTPPDAAGESRDCVPVDSALADEIVANPAGFYVNVHTTPFPAGAIRGQLGAPTRVFGTSLSGTVEVDASGNFRKGDADGTGQAVVSINAGTNVVCVESSVFKVDAPIAAHIHKAAFGVNGPIVVPLPTPAADASLGTGAFSSVGCATAAADLVADIVANPDGYYVNVHTTAFPAGAARGQLSGAAGQYRMLSDTGEVKGFGSADIFNISSIRPTGEVVLKAPAVDLESTPTLGGYYIATSDGGVVGFGDTKLFGNAIGSGSTIVGLAVDPTGLGYVLATTNGWIGFSSAGTSSQQLAALNRPIVGIAMTPTGNGWWLVATDGGVFSFGDAVFHGSTGNIALNQPIVGMASTPTGNGYWMVASDGGIFSFGDADFFGSTGAITLNQPIVGMLPTPTGEGYWLVAQDGGVFSFGDATFLGALSTAPVVAISH
jgi:hypothetical protein